jgi:amino acid transporter
MEPGEALCIAAQIAVTLAGFAGVVVVFRRESIHEWSPADRLRLRLLLTNSILPLVLCMLGLLLLTIRPVPTDIWRWCSGFAFVVSLLFAIRMTGMFRRLDLHQIQSGRVTRLVFYLFGTSGIEQTSCNYTTLPHSGYSGHSSLVLSFNFSPRYSSLRG